MKHLSISLYAAALAVAFAVPALAENVVFQQTAIIGPDSLAYYSDNVFNRPGQNQTAYDNFSVVSDTTLGRVQWNGDLLFGANAINGFTLTIYGNYDPTGTPGFALYQEQVAGLANQTFVGIDQNNASFDDDVYSAPINFQATANTKYWLSIVANTQNQGDWGWTIANPGDNSAYQTGLAVIQPRLSNDLAFTLFDNTVAPPPPPTAATPEPSSLMLLGTGVLGVAGTVRRKFLRNR